MNTAARLLDAAREIWKAYNAHPFVLGIQNGTLEKARFRHYIIQDYLYLEDYAKVFAIGVAKAGSLEMANLFAKYIAVMNGELDVHSGYLARLGITQDEIASTQRALDNLSYTSYMLRIAYEEGEAEIMAAILACAYSYEVIARNMVRDNPESINDAFYGDWVCSYCSSVYAVDNQLLLDTLNRLTRDYSEPRLQHLADIFVACSRYELAFWDMAWNLKT